jgi:hypothetical protein
MLDAFLNITPFDAPAEPTDEQASADLAAEAAAAAAWRLRQRYARGSSDGTAAAAAASGGTGDTAVGGAASQPSPFAADTAAAAAAAAAAGGDAGQGSGDEADGGPGAVLRRVGMQEYRDRVQRWQQWGFAGWSSEDYMLGMQQWLLQRYSSRDDGGVTSTGGAGDESLGRAESTIQRMALCAGELVKFCIQCSMFA